jgi:phosphate transport system substrate-binding protein
MKKNILTIIKRIFSILFGLGITFLFVIILTPFPYGIIDRLFFLICIMYISGIVFLVLWNKAKSKLVYLLFFVPIICITTEIGIQKYKSYVRRIPRVYEELELGFYEPFKDYIYGWKSSLSTLDEVSEFKIDDNVPILDGATAFYPVYAAFVQAVYPKDDYSLWGKGPVKCSRTAKAYNNLLEGNVDIIFCLEPSEMQLQQIYEKNINLKFIPIGKEAFVFFVNIKNPINNLKIEEIQEIYSGKIKNWRMLKGGNKKIIAYQRPENSGSQTILKKMMGVIPIMEPMKEDIKEGMDAIIGEVANYKNFNNAIGYSFLQYSTEMVRNNQIKILSIDGIYPSAETIHDTRYPFIVNIYAVYNDTEEKNKNIEPFIEWILSKQGQTLVSKTGYIPINIE